MPHNRRYWMQMIATIVGRQYPGWMAQVAYGLIEIDHAIEFAAGENPSIDFLTHGFFLGWVKRDRRILQEGILERRISRPYDSDTFCMSRCNQLPIVRQLPYRL